MNSSQSKCADCAGLEVWPRTFGGTRYLCGPRLGEKIKAFGLFGRPTENGIPLIKTCSEYKHGDHYSRRNFSATTERKL